jgi:hypothetical protein
MCDLMTEGVILPQSLALVPYGIDANNCSASNQIETKSEFLTHDS